MGGGTRRGDSGESRVRDFPMQITDFASGKKDEYGDPL